MSLYDIVMLVIFLAAIWFGYWKGLSWQIASLAAIFVSYFVAVTFPDSIANYISAKAPWNRFAAMLILFLGTSMVIWMIFASVSKSIKKMELKGFDRQTGALLGAVKGAVLCMVVTMFSVSLIPQAPEAVHRSLTGGWVVSGMQMLSSVAPQGLSQYIDESLPKLHGPDGNLPQPKNPFGGDSSSWQAGQQGIQGQFQTAPTTQAGYANGSQNQPGQYGQGAQGQYGQGQGQYGNTQYGAVNNGNGGQYQGGYQQNQNPNGYSNQPQGQYNNQGQYNQGSYNQNNYNQNQTQASQNQTGTFQTAPTYGTGGTYGTYGTGAANNSTGNTPTGQTGSNWGWGRGFENQNQPAPQQNRYRNNVPDNSQTVPQSNNGFLDRLPSVSLGENGYPEFDVKINSKEAIQKYGGVALEAAKQFGGEAIEAAKNAAQDAIQNGGR